VVASTPVRFEMSSHRKPMIPIRITLAVLLAGALVSAPVAARVERSHTAKAEF